MGINFPYGQQGHAHVRVHVLELVDMYVRMYVAVSTVVYTYVIDRAGLMQMDIG